MSTLRDEQIWILSDIMIMRICSITLSRPRTDLRRQVKTGHLATVAAVLLTLAWGACAGPLPEPREVAAARDKDAVRAEAILDVYHQGSARYGADLVLCVALDREANRTRVFRNLEGRAPRVRDSGRCVTRELDLVEAISGRQALEAMISDVEMLEPGQARVQAGFLRGPLAGEGRELTLEFILGRWRVTSSKDTWIS
jgi:hypothetical protein